MSDGINDCSSDEYRYNSGHSTPSPSAESGAREWLEAYLDSDDCDCWPPRDANQVVRLLEAYAAHVQSPSSEALIEVNGEKCCPLCCKPVFYSPSPDLAWLDAIDAAEAKMTPDLYYAEGRDVYTHQVRDMANPNGIIASFGQESSGKSEANARGYVLLRNSYPHMSETIRRLERESSVERTAHTTFEEIAKTNQALLRTERAARQKAERELKEARNHCCSDAAFEVQALRSFMESLGLEERDESVPGSGIKTIVWHNVRAEAAERELKTAIRQAEEEQSIAVQAQQRAEAAEAALGQCVSAASASDIKSWSDAIKNASRVLAGIPAQTRSLKEFCGQAIILTAAPKR